MRTMAAPFRYITIVVPVSHMVQGIGSDYFAAMAAQPDPAATRPTLDTLFSGSSKVIQYQGPDIRGRTGDVSSPCSTTGERQFLLSSMWPRSVQPISNAFRVKDHSRRILVISLLPVSSPLLPSCEIVFCERPYSRIQAFYTTNRPRQNRRHKR